MLLAAKSRGKAVVIGGGLLGLEAAVGLKEQGMDVTVLHLAPTLMERQLDAPPGTLLQRAIEARGITVITNANTKAILGEKRVEAVAARGWHATCRPISWSWRSASGRMRNWPRMPGSTVNRGIVVDATMRTSDPDVFALGECAEVAGAGIRPRRAAL